MHHNGFVSRAPLPFLHLSYEINEPTTIVWHTFLRPAYVLELLHWQRGAILDCDLKNEKKEVCDYN